MALSLKCLRAEARQYCGCCQADIDRLKGSYTLARQDYILKSGRVCDKRQKSGNFGKLLLLILLIFSGELIPFLQVSCVILWH